MLPIDFTDELTGTVSLADDDDDDDDDNDDDDNNDVDDNDDDDNNDVDDNNNDYLHINCCQLIISKYLCKLRKIKTEPQHISPRN